MLFSSLIFIFAYLPVLLVANFLARKNRGHQNTVLLIGSLFFYAWGEGERVMVMIVSIIFNYFIGKKVSIGNTNRKLFLAIGVITNLLILGYFKYDGFLVENINVILSIFDIDPIDYKASRLPLGISFYTFQAISYLVDVYRGNCKPQKGLKEVGLYIVLFPQLIAGPIVRYLDIQDQLIDRDENLDRIASGVRRFLVGLGKKVLIANNTGALADFIFGLDAELMSSPLLLVGLLTVGLQVYFDFSGYSDMAIGLGRMFGFELPENFNFPFISQSIQEFWRRWHITLSVWFRDYVYIPLGGSRVSDLRVYANLFVVFFVTGFWHGASWNFILWGLIHGSFIVIERFGLLKLFKNLPPFVGVAYTQIIVMLGWAFAKTDTFGQAINYLAQLFQFNTVGGSVVIGLDIISPYEVLFLVLGVVLSTPIHTLNISKRISQWKSFPILRDTFLLFVFLFSMIELIVTTYNPFIYFRF